MAKFIVAFIGVLAVMVDAGLYRFAGGASSGQLGGIRQDRLGEGNHSGLKDVLLEPKSRQWHGMEKSASHDIEGDISDIIKHEYEDVKRLSNGNDYDYAPGTQETDVDSIAHEYSDDNSDTVSNFNTFNDEHRNKRSNDKNESYIPPDKFIIGGRPTGLGQYPWVVHLEVRGFTCGGSLLSMRHVITAAHCLDLGFRYYYEEVRVYVAEYNTRTFPIDCVGRYCIKNFLMHPDKISIHQRYRSGETNNGIWENDIAMMRLRKPVPNTAYIYPILLPTFNINNLQYDGTPLIVTGWGANEYGQPSSIKLHAQLQLVAPNTCRRYVRVTDDILCAFGNHQDTCRGDSGGPIMVADRGHLYLVGLTSFGSSSCRSPVPSMYTNVYSHLSWILNFMRE